MHVHFLNLLLFFFILVLPQEELFTGYFYQSRSHLPQLEISPKRTVGMCSYKRICKLQKELRVVI